MYIKLFEQFINEQKETALGKDIAKNSKLFNKVIDALLGYAKTKSNYHAATKAKLSKWLKDDTEYNQDFDYLDDLDFSLSGFFEWLDN